MDKQAEFKPSRVCLQEGGGYIVDLHGQVLCVPPDPRNRHYRVIQQWIAAGNDPEPEFTEEELAAREAAELKAARAAKITELRQIKMDELISAEKAAVEAAQTKEEIEAVKLAAEIK